MRQQHPRWPERAVSARRRVSPRDAHAGGVSDCDVDRYAPGIALGSLLRPRDGVRAPPHHVRLPVLKSFRLLSLIEGLSLITLLFIAMPARYLFGVDFVWPVGMAHGLLWMAYVVLSLAVSHTERWSVLVWLLALLCSVVPFGFILLDRRLQRQGVTSSGSNVR